MATFQTAIQHGPDTAEGIEADNSSSLPCAATRSSAGRARRPMTTPTMYYSGIGEATLYVGRDAAGAAPDERCCTALAEECERRGYHKLVGKIFTTNGPSIALVRASGWRDVGTHERHGPSTANGGTCWSSSCCWGRLAPTTEDSPVRP